MGIPILVRRHLYIETAPWLLLNLNNLSTTERPMNWLHDYLFPKHTKKSPSIHPSKLDTDSIVSLNVTFTVLHATRPRRYTLSYYHHHQIGSMNYHPLFRVRSWNNGMRCMSLYIRMLYCSLPCLVYEVCDALNPMYFTRKSARCEMKWCYIVVITSFKQRQLVIGVKF